MESPDDDAVREPAAVEEEGESTAEEHVPASRRDSASSLKHFVAKRRNSLVGLVSNRRSLSGGWKSGGGRRRGKKGEHV